MSSSTLIKSNLMNLKIEKKTKLQKKPKNQWLWLTRALYIKIYIDGLMMKSNQSVDLSFIQDTRFQLIRLYIYTEEEDWDVCAAAEQLHLAARARINDERAIVDIIEL